MKELGRTLGHLNPFARRGPQLAGPSSVGEKAHQGFFSRLRPHLDHTEKAALASAKQVIAGVATRGVVRSMLTSAIGEGAGQATGGILAFAKPVGDVLRGKATAKDIFKRSAFHIAGGSVSADQAKEKAETAKKSIFRRALKGASRVFTAFENASTQVVYGVTRKRSAVSKAINTEASNQSNRLDNSALWQQIFNQRLNVISASPSAQTPPSRSPFGHLEGVAKRLLPGVYRDGKTQAAKQLKQLAGNLSYLRSFDYGAADVFGASGSGVHEVNPEHTREVFTAMHQGLLGALDEITDTDKRSSKIFRDLKRRAEKEDKKLIGRTLAVGALNAAAAGVKVWAFGQLNDSLHIGEMIFRGIKAGGKELQRVIDLFQGDTPATSAQVADLSGIYEPTSEPIPIPESQVPQAMQSDNVIDTDTYNTYTPVGNLDSHSQIPPEDLQETVNSVQIYSPITEDHVTNVSDVTTHPTDLNPDSQLPDGGDYTPAEQLSHVADGITQADELPDLDSIKTVAPDQTVFGGAQNLVSQLQQTNDHLFSGWPKSLNLTSIAGNEQSILTNGLQKWMSLTGHGLDLDHAQRLSSLIAEAHRQTAVLEAVGKTWNDLPSDLKTAFMLSEGLANQVSEEEALSILGLK